MGLDTLQGRWLRRLGLALIALSLVVSLPYLASRWADESRTYKHVALAVDLEEWADLAIAHGGDLVGLMRDVREAGVNLLSIKEVKIARLEAYGLVKLYDPMLGPQWPADMPFPYQPGYIYLRADAPHVFEMLADSLPWRLNPGAVRAELPYIQVRADLETVRDLRTGFLVDDFALAEALGFDVLLRPANLPGSDDPTARLDALARYGVEIPAGTVLLHQGNEVLGFPDAVPAVADAMRERGLVLGLLETPVQLGLVEQSGYRDLARLLGYRAVRVHAFTELELRKLVPADLVDRSLRAVRDRGIGVLYLKAIPPALEQYAWQPITDRAMAYYAGLAADLRAQGYTIGPVEAHGVSDMPPAAYAGLGGAVGAALIVVGALLDLLWPGRRLTALLLLVPVAILPLAAMARLAGGTSLLREFSAFAVATMVPAAAMALVVAYFGPVAASGGPRRRCWVRSIGVLAAATALGIGGGMLLAATLSGPLYTLEFGYFRGVKLAHIVPPAIAAALGILAWWRNEHGQRLTLPEMGARLMAFLSSPLTWAAAAAGVVAGGGLLLVMGRSGHTAGFEVSALEVAFRDLMDVRLLARPRFKEIMLGHPALLLLLWLGLEPRGRWGWVFGLGLAAAAFGQVSVVNSFAHIRTPLLVSLVRSLNGLWVGILISAAAIAALWLAIRVARWSTKDA